ncbi:hypothetical protein TWF694_011237 [Orbilia ellipsospora]|uniref:CFEM domain-containing protein n=1 Tax=Orbilia ellipsospora TaxID=2528407 RepID=A0AAV9XBI8_9PEZI
MKAGKFIFFTALAVGLTSAQLADLPTCAQSCITADTGGCNSLDTSCLCNSQTFVNSVETCLLQSCSASDLQTAVNFFQQLCAATGVTLSGLPGSSTDSTSIDGAQGAPTSGVQGIGDGSVPSTTSTTPSSTPPPTSSSTPSRTSTTSSKPTSSSSSSSSTSNGPPPTRTSNQSSGTSTGNPQSSTSPPPPSKSGLSGGAIAGIVVGVSVPVIAIIAFVAYKMGTRNRLPDAPVVPIYNDPSRKDFGAYVGGIEDPSARWGSGIQDGRQGRV